MIKKLAVFASVILLIIVLAILLPYRGGYRMASDESTAIAGERATSTAEIMYQGEHGQFAPDIRALSVGSSLGKSSPAHPFRGYYFLARPGLTPDSFVVEAIPIDRQHRRFCTVEDGVIRLVADKSSASPISYTGCKSLPFPSHQVE